MGNNGISLKSLHPDMEIHGVDIISEDLPPGFYFYKAVNLDLGVLPYPDDYFDAVLFTHVIEHLQSPLRLGKEISRVMKKGARIYVETPNWTTLLVPSFGFHREQHGPFNFFDDPTHQKPWSKHSLFEFLFQHCGLSINKIGTVRNWVRIPLDVLIIPLGIFKAERNYLVSSFWNLYGWCIYGIATKE
jgi:SAM-dependent methyltransferase